MTFKTVKMDEELKRGILKKIGKGHSYKELENFLSELLKEGIQNMLKAEMDEHLGYEKNTPESVQFEDSRNGHGRKTVKSKSGAGSSICHDLSRKTQ